MEALLAKWAARTYSAVLTDVERQVWGEALGELREVVQAQDKAPPCSVCSSADTVYVRAVECNKCACVR